ncbi:MAG: hypothetical protein HC772_10085 [Leptolyngbyaceae cyanobacterium CRU_2_3]|nr:hypothetical protein [Leptolyngbyaceae cyanobacterium CRU_2_3]
MQGYSLLVVNSKPFRQWQERFQVSQGWLIISALLGLLWLWNWQLVLAVGLGLVALVWVYLVHQGWWTLPKLWNWQKLWSRSNRSLTLAIASGSIVTIGSYLAIAIWRESHHSWLATGIIIEGLMGLAVLLLMVWQMLTRSVGQVKIEGDRTTHLLLADLADTDPLKRLIAVRQLTQQATNATLLPVSSSLLPVSSALPLSSSHLAECFRLMLNRETEAVVCSALLDSLHSLNRLSSLAAEKGDVEKR